MKLSHKVLMLVLTLLLLLSLVSICIVVNYHSPGVHTFGKTIHYEVFETAFWVGTGEKTNLTVYGTYDGIPSMGFPGYFKGYLQVGDCPILFSYVQDIASDKGYAMRNQDGYLIFAASYKSVIDYDYEQEIPIFGDFQYYLILNPAKPEEIIICVYDKDNNPLGAVVNAETPEEAKKIYREYSKTLT